MLILRLELIILYHMTYSSPNILHHVILCDLFLINYSDHYCIAQQLRPTGAKILWVEVSNDNEVRTAMYYAVLCAVLCCGVVWCGLLV